MTQQKKSLPLLKAPHEDRSDAEAFTGDLLKREQLATRLTEYLDRLRAGAVLAIDAPWGEGKTWFGENWAKSLKKDDHTVAFIDAFAQDYIEDPFLLITAEIAEALNKKRKKTTKLLTKAAKVTQTILPIAAKGALNAAGRIFLNAADLGTELADIGKAINDDAAVAISTYLKKHLTNYAKEKKSLQDFKKELTKLAENEKKPIVIFIDELDRCKPTFAVQLIERIKHFFDIPNLVFILLLNRTQLETAIKGIYGAETDASSYLGKFVNFFFSLPRYNLNISTDNNLLVMYVRDIFKRYRFESSEGNFIKVMELMIHGFNLSLRDIERVIALYAFAQPIIPGTEEFLAYLITLKITNPALFQHLLKDEVQAHKKAKVIVDTLQKTLHRYAHKDWDYLLNCLSELHTAHITNFQDIGDTYQRFLAQYPRQSPYSFLKLAEKIDLPLEK